MDKPMLDSEETTDVITTVGADPETDTVVGGNYYLYVVIIGVLVVVAFIGVVISKLIKKGKNK